MKCREYLELDARVQSPPARGAWIEIFSALQTGQSTTSPPARGAWIEMLVYDDIPPVHLVAPRTGGVD